jgi:hypothetical protein
MKIKQATKIRERFGITLPPWKNLFFDKKKNLTLEFIIKTKTIASKKNDNAIWLERNKAVKFIDACIKERGQITAKEAKEAIKLVYGKYVGSKEYKAFSEEQIPILKKQMKYYMDKFKEKGLIYPISKCSIKTLFYFYREYDQDVINKQESILDLLVDVGLLADDNYKVIPKLSGEGESFKDEITANICTVYITIPL